METPGSPFHTTSKSDIYSTTDEPISDAPNRSMNNTDDIIYGDIIYVSIIASIEIPMICLAVYSLIKSKQDVSVFVLNLLISDLILIVCILLMNIWFYWFITLMTIIVWASVTGLYFLTCIAVERYVLIAHPVWHRSHRSVKCLVCTSLTGWLLPFIVIPLCMIKALVYIMPFIPYAVISLCFVGMCRSLAHSTSLTPLKKELVMAPLFFVVIGYTFLILPLQIYLFLYVKLVYPLNLNTFTLILYLLNPLVDCLLYVFMRSDAKNIIRMSHCCTRLKRVQSKTRRMTSIQHDHV